MIKEKRGQAAMEFLMTYGWAILAAVIVIAVLASFGVFSPSTYVPNKCVLNAPLGCNAGTADTAGVSLEVRNGAGESITLQNLVVEGCTDTTIDYTDSTGSGTFTPGTDTYNMPDQELTTFDLGCTLTPGDKFQGDITVTYRKIGSSLDLTSTGEITDSVE